MSTIPQDIESRPLLHARNQRKRRHRIPSNTTSTSSNILWKLAPLILLEFPQSILLLSLTRRDEAYPDILTITSVHPLPPLPHTSLHPF